MTETADCCWLFCMFVCLLVCFFSLFFFFLLLLPLLLFLLFRRRRRRLWLRWRRDACRSDECCRPLEEPPGRPRPCPSGKGPLAMLPARGHRGQSLSRC